ncbi:MAG: alpha/beta hydrolase [Armatimonadota bacterium]
MPDSGRSKKRITVDGITLAYEDYGRGRPVVFVHGVAATSFAWNSVAGMLSDTCRAVCFDLMGFGDSDKPRKESYTYRRQAELLLEAINQLGLERPVLAGHSLGGGVCLAILQELGNAHQKAVSGLVLVDTVCYPQKIPVFLRFLKVPVLPALVMKVFPEGWGMKHSARSVFQRDMQSESIDIYTHALQSNGAHSSLIATAKSIIPSNLDDFVSSYSRISVPTRIIWGRHDNIVPLELGRKLAEEIGTAGFYIIEESGHCPHEERPEEVARLIGCFLEDQS